VGLFIISPAVRGRDIFGYSHMMAVAGISQNKGVGAQLKWAQRARALVRRARLYHVDIRTC
jgi:predicted GNAT superfamily acetyltransferase